MNIDKIPQELKDLPHWVLWNSERKDGKKTKVPYQPNGVRANITNQETWNTFEMCIEVADSFSGIGFVFSDEDPFTGIDWDDVRNPDTGDFIPEIWDEITGLNSYAEISHSGKGAHAIVKANKPGDKCKKKDKDNTIEREMYNNARFFVMTGDHIFGTQENVNQPNMEVFRGIYAKIESGDKNKKETQSRPERVSASLSNSEIISKCGQSANNEKFRNLWSGSVDEYNSDSEADLALCSIFAFYTQDEEQIDRLFQQSALYRKKWDRRDYRDRTIKKALAGLTETWQLPTPTPTNGNRFADSEAEEVTEEELNEMVEHEKSLKLPDFRDILEDDHFISTYMDYGTSITDAYPEYHLCGALWMLSSIVSGNVVLKLKQVYIEPNLWIVLLGSSTTSRKSTGVNTARKIVESSTGTQLPNQDFSIEGYLETLADNPVLDVVRDEAAGAMRKHHKKYNEGIFELECSVYDGDNIKKTLASGKNSNPKTFEVVDPYVTHFYATTPSNYASAMTIEDFECGYGLRFVFAWPRYKKERKNLEMETQENIDVWGNVVIKLKKLYTAFQEKINPIEFDICEEAMHAYNEIVEKLEDFTDETDNDMLKSAVGRSQVHILKLAMLLEIGKSEPSYKIHKRSIELASYMVISYFLPNLMAIIDRLHEDVKNNQVERVIQKLRQAGGKSRRSELLKNSRLKKRDFDECIDTLIEAKVIEQKKVKETGALVYVLVSDNNVNVTFNDHMEMLRRFPSFHTFHDITKGSESNVKNRKNQNNSSLNARRGFSSVCENVKDVKDEKNGKDEDCIDDVLPKRFNNVENEEDKSLVTHIMEGTGGSLEDVPVGLYAFTYGTKFKPDNLTTDQIKNRMCELIEVAGGTVKAEDGKV